MRKRFAILSAAALAALAGAGKVHAGTLPAFPGAEGFGANAAGGRGGDVYHVTTLADDPTHSIPGSLFYGLYEKNVPGSGTVPGVGRTIVFDVGGTIHLGATALDIKNIKNVTIAGQTAPSPITIIGNTLQITGSSGKETGNIILQHINLRKGVGDGEDALSVKGSGNTHDIMVDHVSGSWSEDEVISVTQNATNVTIQNSTMSEALTDAHAYGALIRPTVNSNVSYNRNLFSHQKSRNPRPGSYDGMTLNYEFQNNVIYNWSDRAGYIAGADSNLQILNMNYAGNYLIAGPMAVNTSGNPTRRETAFLKENNASPLELHVYQDGNVIDSNATPARDGTNTGWGMFRQVTSGAYGPWPEADKNASRFLFPASTPDSADVAYAKTIGQVGAFPWARSATDQRLINDVINYTGTAPITAPPAGEWNAIDTAPMTTRPAGWDTDFDGMPNWWETARGFNPSAADNNTLTASGYTRLEKYLHFLSAQANWNLNADGAWSQHMNWRGMRPESSDATANFVAGITAPRTVTVDMPVTVGQLTFAGNFGYTIEGVHAVTVDVISGTASIDVAGGSHAITAPLTLVKNTAVTVAAGSTLTVSNLQDGAAGIIKKGDGTLSVNGVRAASLDVQAGVLKLLPSGGAAPASKVASLAVAANAKLDLGDNKLVINGGNLGSSNGSTYSGIQGLVQSANNGGAWDGNGISTSMPDAASGLTTLAVATGEQTGYAGGTFAGASIAAGDVIVMYTYAGDANLDGAITGDDYSSIDFNIAVSNADGYYNGDFNYDGIISGDDYSVIDFSIVAQGAAFPTAATASPMVAAAVPEPATTLAALLGCAALYSRRRKLRPLRLFPSPAPL